MGATCLSGVLPLLQRGDRHAEPQRARGGSPFLTDGQRIAASAAADVMSASVAPAASLGGCPGRSRRPAGLPGCRGSGRSCSGTSPSVMNPSPRWRWAMRSTRLRRSRTLPGYARLTSRSRTASSSSGGSRSGCTWRKKCRNSGMMSSVRSRRLGRCSVQPAIR